MDRETVMHPLVALAYTTITRTLEKGEAKGHGKDAWRSEPAMMHGLKTIGHMVQAIGLHYYPKYFRHCETDVEHGEQAMVRANMFLRCLLDEIERNSQNHKSDT